jgi:hypothetical protein
MVEINLTVGSLEPTGELVAVPQHAVEITIQQVAADGTTSEQTVTALVPDFFLGLEPDHLEIVKRWLIDVLIQNEIRKAGLG